MTTITVDDVLELPVGEKTNFVKNVQVHIVKRPFALVSKLWNKVRNTAVATYRKVVSTIAAVRMHFRVYGRGYRKEAMTTLKWSLKQLGYAVLIGLQIFFIYLVFIWALIASFKLFGIE